MVTAGTPRSFSCDRATMDPGVYRLSREACATAAEQLQNSGWTTYHLPAGIKTRDSFFDAVRRSCPLDPPLVSNRSWDALSDSLWEGLRISPAKRLAIIWEDASCMAGAAAADFEVAHEILTDLARSLADPTPTLGEAKALVVILGM